MDAMPLFLLDDLLKGTPILKSPKTPKEWHLPVFDVEFWDLHFKTWHVLGVSFSHCAKVQKYEQGKIVLQFFCIWC